MKVLLISHNPITTYQNMGKTFLSMFSRFKEAEICQFYIYPTVPDTDVCTSYYRVTDRDIMKSYFSFGKINAKIFDKDSININKHILYENKEDEEFYKKKKKNSLTLLLRDTMWFFSNWYDSNLKGWLEEQKPSCILLAPGESKFIYNIALYLSKKLNIKLYIYVCDEYYFVEKPHSFIDRVHVHILRRKIKQTINKSSGMIVICDELAELYHNEFKIETYTLYTGAYALVSKAPSLHDEILGLTYMGNMSNDRYVSIAEIGKVLDKINSSLGTNYKVFLYTRELNSESKSCFEGINSIIYCGYVTGDDYIKTLFSADVLLHVESFNEKNCEKVKHSISTKIADYLGTGIPVMAYGPNNIASINYLYNTESAFVCTDKDDLYTTIVNLFDIEERKKISKKALSTGYLNHNSIKNSDKLKKILFEGDIS